jgi:pimeloyl-ACP methyl ester carboxylesterase
MKHYELARLCFDSYLTQYKFGKKYTDGHFRFHSKSGTQLFTVWDDEYLVFVFRGTEVTDWNDIKADIQMERVTVGGSSEGAESTCHRGFKAALDAVWSMVERDYRKLANDRKVVFTGHSLGGGLATLACSRLGVESAHLVTFGCPRVFNHAGANVFDYRFENVWRYRNNNDVICRSPTKWLGYHHVGKMMYFDCAGELTENPSVWFRLAEYAKGVWLDKADMLKDHFMKNYVNLTRMQL